MFKQHAAAFRRPFSVAELSFIQISGTALIHDVVVILLLLV